jgi:hypothetical protein
VSTTELPRTVLQRSQSLSRLAALAIVGQLVLITTALLLPIWSEYSLIGDNISELALGRYGFVQAAAFLIAGLGTHWAGVRDPKAHSGFAGVPRLAAGRCLRHRSNPVRCLPHRPHRQPGRHVVAVDRRNDPRRGGHSEHYLRHGRHVRPHLDLRPRQQMAVVLALVGDFPSWRAGADACATARTADWAPAVAVHCSGLRLADPSGVQSPLDRGIRDLTCIQPDRCARPGISTSSQLIGLLIASVIPPLVKSAVDPIRRSRSASAQLEPVGHRRGEQRAGQLCWIGSWLPWGWSVLCLAVGFVEPGNSVEGGLRLPAV